MWWLFPVFSKLDVTTGHVQRAKSFALLEFGHFRSMQLKTFLDLLGLGLVAHSKYLLHLESLTFRNEASFSPKGINNAAQGCGAAATLGQGS
jgi:hypothetical protein